MISVSILEATDVIQSDDWCRPLAFTSMSNGYSDHYSFRNMYSGTPENNAKWVQAKHVIGKCWFGKTVGEFNGTGYSKHWPVETRMEFVRGNIPQLHQLSMKGYTSYANLPDVNEDDDDY